jgi:hypothetical protein
MVIAGLLALSAPGATLGASRAWLVSGEPDGGGPSDHAESTTLQLAEITRSLGATTQALMADPTPEAIAPRSEPAAALQPLARVFGQQAFNAAASARRHRLGGGTAVGMRADTLSNTLAREFSTMGASDRGLLFYAGPGLSDPSDAAGNTLRLWDDTALSVRELETLSSRAPTTVPLRFVMTQCHASGFLRLMRPGARDQRGLGPYNRCVFTAEPVDHLNGRCPAAGMAATDPEQPRGYAHDFFAALAGNSRADLDGDRVVTLHEAHLHAVVTGDSADLPRSTSEAYLERWQPVWLRYLETRSEPDNEYGRMAGLLAARLKLPPRGQALRETLQTRQKDMNTRLQRLADESRRVNADIERLQGALRRALLKRWPAAAHPYTAGYARFLVTDAGAAQHFLLNQADAYPALVARQERQAQIARDRQTLDRHLTQLDKLLRMRQLARLREQFERHASLQARQEFERLSRCERLPL